MPKNNGARGSHVKNPNNTNSKMINTHHTLKHHPKKGQHSKYSTLRKYYILLIIDIYS